MERRRNCARWRTCTRSNEVVTSRFGKRSLFLNVFIVLASLLRIDPSLSGDSDFITRSGDHFMLHGRPFSFMGANAYYLPSLATLADTQSVKDVLADASALGMKVIRMWAFHEGADTLDPTVIQFSPGMFNERALRGLDYVLWQAEVHSVRVILALVGNWDDFGGMNQYVRWRVQMPFVGNGEQKFTKDDLEITISGEHGRSYRKAISEELGHDDFYTDPTIRDWYKQYLTVLTQRVNAYTGTMYKDDPTILGWELANEPRSSDRTGLMVRSWLAEMSSYLKTIDPIHLVGSGEEGFDITSVHYSLNSYHQQQWMFDGTAGVSFSVNAEIPSLDFASIHLYPDFWNLPSNSGNAWIQDHTRIATTLNKPLIVGEFGARRFKETTYSSWLSTAIAENADGTLVWQMLGDRRSDTDGFGIRCPEQTDVCGILRRASVDFEAATDGTSPPPAGFTLRQNYPNPFNGQTVVEYTLPVQAYVTIGVWNAIGQQVMVVYEGFQRPGVRRELVNADGLASGAYFVRVSAQVVSSNGFERFVETRSLLHLK